MHSAILQGMTQNGSRLSSLTEWHLFPDLVTEAESSMSLKSQERSLYAFLQIFVHVQVSRPCLLFLLFMYLIGNLIMYVIYMHIIYL